MEDLAPPRGVGDLGMELDTQNPAFAILHGRHGRAGAGGDRDEPGRGHGDGVAMAHPDFERFGKFVE